MENSNLNISNSPVFVHGMMGGGTGIIWNFIQSHPRFIGIGLETNEIFRFHPVLTFKKLITLKGFERELYIRNFILILKKSLRLRVNPMMVNQLDSKTKFEPKRSLSCNRKLQRLVDNVFHEYLEYRILDSMDSFKNPYDKYTSQDLANIRLVAKNNEGLCMYSNWFSTIYSNAKYIGVCRNPYVIVESQIRHNRTPDIKEIVNRVGVYYGKLLERSIQYPDKYLLVKYEDLMKAPLEVSKVLFSFLGEDFNELSHFSFLSRNYLGKNNNSEVEDGTRRKTWYPKEQVKDFIRTDINKKSISNLSAEEIKYVSEELSDLMLALQYKII